MTRASLRVNALARTKAGSCPRGSRPSPRCLANALFDKPPSNRGFLGRPRNRRRRPDGGRRHARNDDNARRENLAVAAARLRWLEGAPRVKFAIGQAGYLLAAAEVEIRSEERR